MRRFLLVFLVVGLLPASLLAASEGLEINLRYRNVPEATGEIAKQLGPEGTAAVLSTDEKRNSVTLRSDHPATDKVRDLLMSIDRRQEQVQLNVTLSRKTKAGPGEAAQEEIIARPLLIGTPGKPMIVSFERNGETFQIEVNATLLKP